MPGQGGHRRVLGALVGHLVVDLVGEHHQVARLGDVDHLGQHLAWIDRPGRVVGRDDDHGARPRCHQARKFVEVRQPVVFRRAGVVHRRAVGQMGGCGPQGIVGAGHQDLVPLVEQSAQREQDQLAHPVAHEDIVRVGVHDPAALLLHHHRLAGRENSLLVAIGFGVAQVLDHRQAHGFGRTKPEGAGIADVQLHDLVPRLFQLGGPTRQRTTDLVADVGKLGAGLNSRRGHCDLGGNLPETCAARQCRERDQMPRSAR